VIVGSRLEHLKQRRFDVTQRVCLLESAVPNPIGLSSMEAVHAD
jgi:hypothetical protein